MASHFPAVPVRSHPIHGILSAYPMAFFTGALATDAMYAQSANMMWASFSAWLIAAGILMGALAALVGIVDAIAARGRRRRAGHWPHSLLTAAMMAVALVNAFIHSRDAWTSVVPTGIILSLIVAVLALASSWMGYSLQARQEAN